MCSRKQNYTFMYPVPCSLVAAAAAAHVCPDLNT